MNAEELARMKAGLDRILSAPVVVEMKNRIADLERENARLSAVAGQHRDGDVTCLRVIGDILRSHGCEDGSIVMDCLGRMLAAAKIMEVKE